MAVIKASLDVTRHSLPQSAAMVSSAFRIFSVAASSVLKEHTLFSKNSSMVQKQAANQNWKQWKHTLKACPQYEA